VFGRSRRRVHANPLLAAVALAFVGTGCTTTARLYPVSGPILSQHATSLNTTLTNAPAGHGKIELALPDGELMKGRILDEGRRLMVV
jgi:hypothetical protein